MAKKMDAFWELPLLSPEDQKIVDAYLKVGKPVDQLPYSEDFKQLMHELGEENPSEASKSHVFQRLLQLRKKAADFLAQTNLPSIIKMDRGNPYEAAFEAYLKAHGLCTVAVDETRRTLWGTTSVKNLDFIVLSQTGVRLLVDVKGRQFPGGPAGKERCTCLGKLVHTRRPPRNGQLVETLRTRIAEPFRVHLSHRSERVSAARYPRSVELA